jgi:hypothetical protein
VELYFKEDCGKIISMMSDTVEVMDGDGMAAVAELEDQLCEGIKRAIRDKEKTYKDYLALYETEVLTREELEERFKFKLPDYFSETPTDIFFVGHELKEGVPKESDFIWDDLFVFMVRKENGRWVMRGASG